MRNGLKALRLVFPMCPLRLTFYMLLSLPGAVLPAVMLHLQRQIVDGAAVLGEGFPLEEALRQVLLLIGTYMVYKCLHLAAMQYMEFGYFRYVLLGLDAKIHEKSAGISLERYDSAEYAQIVQNARQASMFLVFTANLAVMSFTLGIRLLSVGGYLTILHPLLIVFVVLVSVPVILEKYLNAKYRSGQMQETIPGKRRKEYAAKLLTDSNRKKELAHHGACHQIADKYREACREINTIERRELHKTSHLGLLLGGWKALFHGMAVCLMIWLLARGEVSVGGFSILLTSFSELTGAFGQLFDRAGEILQTGLMASAFFHFMDFEEKDGEQSMEEGVEMVRMEHVFYWYPGAQKPALRDISLCIKEGQRIAVVGENGAGKTTLAKLLSGFLLPTKGRMEMGSLPRERLCERSILEQISAVYQEFGRYQLTVAQNIYLGDSKSPMDKERISRALVWAGLNPDKYPQDMLLGREFGGTELSGGQWQRLALARSYYRQRSILFLDEPTAAIDPLEEMALYEKLEEMASGRTVILVTHRLGAVKSADQIFVMDDGGILESGSFCQLIEKKGRFYQIWNEQVKWYQEKNRD